MKANIHHICSAVKLRSNKYGCELTSIYWRERLDGGRTRQASFYWGALPTERLEKLLICINAPERNERKKICRMVGISPLPKEKLLDSDFLKKEILDRFKEKEKQHCGKGVLQIPPVMQEKVSAITNGSDKLQAETLAFFDKEIRIFNGIRKAGVYANWLLDRLPGKRMTIDLWQYYQPKFVTKDGRQMSLEMFKFYASIARNNEPFTRSNRPTDDMVRQYCAFLK